VHLTDFSLLDRINLKKQEACVNIILLISFSKNSIVISQTHTSEMMIMFVVLFGCYDESDGEID
jgi:hypothetical protein